MWFMYVLEWVPLCMSSPECVTTVKTLRVFCCKVNRGLQPPRRSNPTPFPSLSFSLQKLLSVTTGCQLLLLTRHHCWGLGHGATHAYWYKLAFAYTFMHVGQHCSHPCVQIQMHMHAMSPVLRKSVLISTKRGCVDRHPTYSPPPQNTSICN